MGNKASRRIAEKKSRTKRNRSTTILYQRENSNNKNRGLYSTVNKTVPFIRKHSPSSKITRQVEGWLNNKNNRNASISTGQPPPVPHHAVSRILPHHTGMHNNVNIDFAASSNGFIRHFFISGWWGQTVKGWRKTMVIKFRAWKVSKQRESLIKGSEKKSSSRIAIISLGCLVGRE